MYSTPKTGIRKTSKLEKLWREAHDNTGSKASRRNHRAETADSWAIAERSKRECMAPVLGILPEREEQNKDFEVDDLLPWSEEMKSWFSAE